MKPLALIILCSLFVLSCNPVGEKITEETPADMQLVNTIDGLDLKKGDVIVVWSKLDASFVKNGMLPSFDFIYNLSLNGNTTDNSSVALFTDKKNIIHSTYTKQKEEEEEETPVTEETSEYSDDSDTIKVEKQKEVTASWQFEQKVTEIPIKQDGKYTLDYKVKAKDADSNSMFNKVAIMIRKK
ncbi:hypothetical protein [Chryseobacterium herbae]|uniref:DUF4625 domain-containing protein n=1 Tax=Chryseobacterium herbae TaxID=2976476 RepID=A0ABT2IZV5_9FLAO|nr:hypothetical protein [Chryseobacterium sp. pc1-10]MCT2564399.1 hypothetical protein [Chryseobacterium sp. pc1-10]